MRLLVLEVLMPELTLQTFQTSSMIVFPLW